MAPSLNERGDQNIGFHDGSLVEVDKTRLHGFAFPWQSDCARLDRDRELRAFCQISGNPPVSLLPFASGPMLTTRSLLGTDFLALGFGASSRVLPGNHRDEHNYHDGNRDQSYIRRD